ncbi:MAG: polysaccharide deacetylase family protein, partial [Nocardiopsaceae bacterium]|nr:polysaccharide deacetylase family protein [Nocardiopsaceae bacterium]
RDLLGRGPGSRGLAARGPRGGGTVLLHDTDRSGQQGWRAALDALPGIVADCRDRGWAAGPLGEHWTRPGQAPA